jgi:UDP-arabinose 4-epimerase
MLRDYEAAYGLFWISLRYFNAAGADPDGEVGELHEPEPHLIPLALAATGPGAELTINGDDYDTPDGTCIRDFVHVTDLADAHVRALQSLLNGGGSRALNLGTGRGFSVREVVTAVEGVTGRKVQRHTGPRRPGDPAALVADPARARGELGWTARYTDIDPIIETAWRWMQRGA